MKRLRVALAALLLVAGILSVSGGWSGIAEAAEAAWKVVVNGKPSTLKVVQIDRANYLPVSFPVESGEQVWEVRIRTDASGHVVQVSRALKQGKVQRGSENCWFCNGSGKCGSCYPQGSGTNTGGLPCVPCNGTGVCQPCGGTGKKSN